MFLRRLVQLLLVPLVPAGCALALGIDALPPEAVEGDASSPDASTEADGTVGDEAGADAAAPACGFALDPLAACQVHACDSDWQCEQPEGCGRGKLCCLDYDGGLNTSVCPREAPPPSVVGSRCSDSACPGPILCRGDADCADAGKSCQRLSFPLPVNHGSFNQTMGVCLPRP